MKPVYFAFCLLLCTCVRAQNDYQLFRPGVQYLYENPEYDGNPYSFQSQYYGVRVDSLGCADLYNSLGGYLNSLVEGACEVSSPFGSSICQTADSTLMQYRFNETFVVYQNAGLGERWLANDDPTDITAEVTAIDSMLVLGLPDLVKRITFSTEEAGADGVDALISRRYGLLTGMRFDQLLYEDRPLPLAGMNSPAVGSQLPEAEAYGLAAIGDTFQIEAYNALGAPFGNTSRFGRRYSTVIIVEVDTSQADTYAYRARASFYDYNPRSADTLSGYRATVLDTLIGFTTQRLPVILRGVQPGQAYPLTPGDSSRLVMAKLEKDSCGLLRLRESTPVNFDEDDNCGLDDTALDGGPGQVFTQHVPFTLDSISGQGGPSWSRLMYLSSDDRQCGTFINPAGLPVSIKDNLREADLYWQLYPNPAHARLVVELPVTSSTTYDLRLYNVAGAQVQRHRIGGGVNELPVIDLPRGAYFIVVLQGGRAVARRRVVIN